MFGTTIQGAAEAVLRFLGAVLVLGVLGLGSAWLLVRAAEEGLEESRAAVAGTWEEP
jgi:uncharacterized protein YdgA (DUF945 family)